MKLPRFLRRETRQANGYTDLVLAGIEANAGGTDTNALLTGAVETAAGLWGRTLAAAKVEGTDALTARVRAEIGRALIRTGEAVYLVRVEGGRIILVRASHWQVLEGWRYRLDIPMPPGKTVQVTVPRSGVLHVQWHRDPREPWKGIGPLQAAPRLATLIAQAEGKLSQDLNTPSATIVPIPTDGGEGGLDSLRSDIGNARGGALVAEGTSRSWDGEAQNSGTRHDWRGERLGPSIPDSLLGAYRDISAAVYAACGIPVDLLVHDTDGTAQRESYRRWVMQSVEPMASVIAEAAGEALDVDVSFDFSPLWAHDTVGRAGAFAKLVAAGMEVERAARLSGVLS